LVQSLLSGTVFRTLERDKGWNFRYSAVTVSAAHLKWKAAGELKISAQTLPGAKNNAGLIVCPLCGRRSDYVCRRCRTHTTEIKYPHDDYITSGGSSSVRAGDSTLEKAFMNMKNST
jgi:predicted RNA-binding Zn-ribbon protein involved in translation (DUF1610 family)